ncbi:hypothetical protein BRC64_07710 [Halobacteriales archaeon QH_10_67_22]|jgi:hypothetical protein|nr:MAG: hypothetical protein BRC64_07710 [Halobacteriales archaeon QH_10_67_22]
MARGQDEPSDGDEGPILSPEELDISDDEHVAEIGDGRYVVSPNEPIGDVPGHAPDPVDGSSDAATGPDPDPEHEYTGSGSSPNPVDRRPEPTTVTEPDVRNWLTDQFEETDSRYGFDVTGKFDGSVRHRQMVSNDVVTIFESLVLWYAQQIDNTTPVEEVLGILLREANVPIQYPAASLQQLVESTDLDPDDSVADLLEAVGDDGFRL